jgi:hypothetical protein
LRRLVRELFQTELQPSTPFGEGGGRFGEQAGDIEQ